MSSDDSLHDLKEALRQFAADRDWDQFHTASNLATALSVEIAELQEHFLWTSVSEVDEVVAAKRTRIAEEIGDVLLYLIRLADKVGVDPVAAAREKLRANALKYPVDKARGNHKKYTEL
jgi:dCTP diphosphatase